MVFHRFDSFLNRLNTMVEFFNTAVQVHNKQFTLHIIRTLSWENIQINFPQFLKLEKVEIGGIRGKALTSNINKVYEEFRVNSLIILILRKEHQRTLALPGSVRGVQFANI